MKKLIIAITLFLGAFVVRAEDTGITTSQAYVETKVSEKQSAAPANNANSVMTYDSTSDDGIGAKAIYDATESYSNQKNALMTADTANAAIQNAINNEFTCANPPKCTLWNMAGIFQQDNPTPYSASRNLFNKNTATDESFIHTTGEIRTPADGNFYKRFSISDYIAVTPGQRYTITNVRPGESFDSGIHYYNANKVWQRYISCNGQICHCTPQNNNEVYIRFNMLTTQKDVVQMEKGSTATAYEPYQNLYIPQNQ